MGSDEQLDPFASIEGMLSGGLAGEPKRTTQNSLVRLEKAPNPIRFIEDEKFLGIGTLYPFQFNVLASFFEARCVFCNEIEKIQKDFSYPPEYQTLYEYGVCPKCGFYKYDQPENLFFYQELIGVAGMRGGKSVVAACGAHVLVHDILTCDNLQQRLGLLEGQTIEGAFAAVSSAQAQETVWDHFMNFYQNSKWYSDYVEQLKQLERNKDNKFKSGELIKDKSGQYLYFGDRKLRIKSLHSNSATLAGKTRIFAVIDELSRFDSSESKKGSEEVYRVLRRSLANIGASVQELRKKSVYDVPDSRMISITSPMFTRDKAMRLLEEAKEEKRIFSFYATTFQMNPTIKPEHLSIEFSRDITGARRDYLAIPPGAEHPLISDGRIVDVCVTNTPSMFSYKEVFFDLDVQGTIFNYLKLELLNLRFNHLCSYVLHADQGRNKDSFGIAIGHMEDDVLVFDGILEARPIPKGNKATISRQIHFPSMTNLILEISKKLSLAVVSYDRWNSLGELDRLREANILAIGKNLDRDDHVKLVEMFRSGKVKLPKKEHDTLDPFINRNLPISKAIEEFKALEDDGKSVPQHPPNLSNDLAQCLTGVSRGLLTPEKLIDTKKLMQDRRKQLGRNPFKKTVGRVVHMKRYI